MSKTVRTPAFRRPVLIVEDEHALCELLSDYVTGAGFEARCVQSDRQAQDALAREGPFACLIVDVNLGAGTTGYDVARLARRHDAGLAVVYVSGQTSEASYRLNGVPGSLFLPKPFTAAELMERVRMLLGDNDDQP